MLQRPSKALLTICLLLLAMLSFSQEYNNFEVRYQNNIRGDLTFIANQIVNREVQPGGPDAEDPYNNLNNSGDYWPASNRNHETGGYYNYNDYKDMRYIDVDGDPSTFNSSTTSFAFPTADCNLIRYAGLYWSATYPRDNTTDPVGTPRQHPVNQVKFKVPGGSYVAITADEILYDGLTDPALSANAPYAAYADVTTQLTALADPTGDYTVADIPVAQGVGYDLSTGTSYMTGGSAGGWTLVIVYENPTLTGKLITTFDGFARVTGTDEINIDYNGFSTIPSGPVNADIGAATLEGDFRIAGDGMSISAASNFPTFTPMSNAANPANNFFNSNITLDGVQLPGRTPSSSNTLGFDADIFRLNNFSNSVIPNNETGATFRFTTNGDQYYPFFNSFNIEIIEPEIVLEKRVEDIAGNDITGAGVNLGQILDYVLSFRNIGNDDGDNYTIRDILPINVTLDETNMTLPAGVTYTFDAPTRTVLFSIPNQLVEAGRPTSSIRMRVQVAENCFDFIDACTDLIQNLAYSTYQGVFNNNPITDDPSVTEFNNCTPPIPGATNFLLDDLSDCNFTRTVQLCGDDVLLDAGDNFDSYVWVRDDNGNNLLDPSDTVLNDGDPDGDPSTLTVTEEGTYIVDKIVADPCKGFKEILIVERFGSNTINPIIDYFNTVNGDADVTNDIQGEIVTCGIDGDTLPKIFLCGANDAQILQTNITDAQTISWELLDESSCTAAPNDCANKNLGCTWNQVHTGGTYTANTAGKYRLVVTYQNGCFNRFYFDVFQNILDIQYNSRDIICTTDGSINITNLGTNYGFQLVDITNNNILVSFSANNGPNFVITSNGAYRVEVVQLDGTGNPIPNACIFSTPDIGILDRDFQVDITPTSETCNTQGSIQIDILNVEPNYTYVLRQSDGTLIDDETAQPDNTHTFNVTAGDYIVEASTDDGCFLSQNVTVNRIPDPTLSAVTTRDIGCSAGMIAVTATGGFPNPDYGYAIWNKDGTDLYPSVAAIPGGAYQVEDTFSFGWRDTDHDGTDEYFPGEDGTYIFVVVDANGCFAFSNPVTIDDNGPMTITPTNTEIVCSGSSTASLTIGTSGGVGPFMFSIDDGANYQPTDTFVNLAAGTYNLRVVDSSGCEIAQTYTIANPFTLSASAGVTEVVECNPANTAEVRITNAQGGIAPYEYSFDGGANYGPSNIAQLPPGTHDVVIRDSVGCTYPMSVVVPDPVVAPTITPIIDYECDGEANITISTSNPTDFDYTYELNSTLNTPADSNVFNNVPVGTQTLTVNYISNSPPIPSQLILEDFGVGSTTNIAGISEIDPVYCYEAQSAATCDGNNAINDLQYSVTNTIQNTLGGSWVSPNDQDDPVNGRYYVLNVGNPGRNTIVYAKRGIEVIPNRDIIVSLDVINLVRQGRGLIRPNVLIELVDSSNTIIASETTGLIPENTGPDSWIPFTLPPLNPGANATIDIVIRTIATGTNGNDIAIDNIRASQVPQICASSIDIPVVIEGGRAFEANAINSTNVSCNGLSDGTITFEVENFDAVAGFDYSLDGGTSYINSTTSPITTPAIYPAGTHTVLIRKADDNTCTTTISETITEPAPLVANAAVTTTLSCDSGATITSSATGGTPNYTYQLEDDSNNVIAPFDFATNGNNTTFTGLPTGDYIVRVRDNNDACEDVIDTPITIAPLNPIVFDITPTNCYSGAGDGAIVVNVTNGNGGYQFRRDGGPWITPSPANATTFTFGNLTDGSYDIEVRDSLGCPLTAPAPQTAVIEPELSVSATAPTITACGSSTDIAITAIGGDGNYAYAVIPSSNTIQDSDFSTTNPVGVNAANTYDVYVRDTNGGADYCEAIFSITITQDPPIVFTPTPTGVSCFGGSEGTISIAVDSGGQGPFMYSIDNGTTYVVGNTFTNLSAGTYPTRVRDTNGCESDPTDVTVLEPAQLASEAAQSQDYTCAQLGQITVGISPTTTIDTSGGSGNYQYSLNGGAWTTSTTGGHTFVDLVDGTYSIRVRDANATTCEITLPDVIINALPTTPSLTSSITYNCDGSGEVTIAPFNAAFTYILDGTLPGQTGVGANVFNAVSIGNHAITVDYGSDCTVDIPVVVADGNAFEASITAFENVACFGGSSGTITIAANNFSTGYEYSLNGAPFVGPFTAPVQLTGLSSGIQNIDVRDVNTTINSGCPVFLAQALTHPIFLVASANVTTPFTCNNIGATITAGAFGGTPTYQYQLEDTVGGIFTAYQASTTFPNVPAGSYIVRVRDFNLCEDPIDAAIVISTPVAPNFTAVPTACYSGAGDGQIQVAIDAGSLPGNGGFQFSIDGGPYMTPTPSTASTYAFTGLTNGTYTIDVRDGFGCPAPRQNITINPQLTANAVLIQDLTCLVDASITITANGGSGTFSYEWGTTATGPWNTTGFTANIYTTNSDGTYFFRVTDTTSPTACEVVSNPVVVSPIVIPSITSVTPTNLNCNADNSGALDIIFDTSLGLAPYVIDVQNTTTATNYGTQTTGLPAGNYTVTLTDAKGCTDTENAVITQPDPINYLATSVPITCDAVGMNTNPGSITITGTTGGTPEYTYILTANNGIPTQTYTTTSGARDHTFNILNFGIYQIDIVDANGCASFSTEIIASPPNDLDIDVSTATANCATGGTAIVTVGAAVGSGNYQFAVLETFTSPYSSTYVGPDPLPLGNTDTATFTGLTPGITYTFVVHDLTTNCYYFETADAPIDSPSNMTTTLDAVANVTCTGAADGNISFTFDNYDVGATAVDYEIFNSQSNVSTGDTGSTNVNPPAGPVTVTDFATLPPGEYYLLLSEVGGAFPGCTVFGGEFTIRQSVNLLDIDLTITENDNCNLNAGVITAAGQFGTAPYEYQFLPTGSTPPTSATWAGSSTNVFNGEGGTYDVYIKDANDCIQMDSIFLPTDPSPEISLTIVDECLPEGTFEVLVTLDVAGIAPYALSVNGAAFQNVTFNGSNQYTISNLSSGLAQTVAIQDLNGCGETENFDIQPPLQFNASLTKLLDCQIAPANNAEITIDVVAGSGSYEYEITGPVSAGPAVLPSNPFVWNLASAPGTYTVTISDTNTALPHCSVSRTVVVPAAIEPILSVDSFTDITCFGANDGTISVSATDNGIGPFTFEITSLDGTPVSINPTTSTATTAEFTGLAPTTTAAGYIVTVRANPATNNCTTDSASILIAEPAIVDVPLTAITVVPFACTNGNNGDFASISVSTTGAGSVSGGSGNYVRYEFIDVATSAVVQDGPNDTYIETTFIGTDRDYDVIVYDDQGCSNSASPTRVTIPGYDELLSVTTSYTVSCNPISDGQITLTTTSTLNDTTKFEYSIDNGITWQTELSHTGAQNVFSGLAIGIHNFLVRHADTGCILPVSETIADPNTFEIDILGTSDIICHNSATGTVTFDVTDPIGGYAGTYSWNIFNTNGTPSNPADDGPAIDSGTSASFASNSLPAGEYRIAVTQDNAPTCANGIFFNIAGPADPLGGDRRVTEITCNPTDNGIIEIFDVLGGWGDYRYLVFDTTTIPTPDTNDRAIYNSNPRFENLTAGTYQVWLIDANGCPLQLTDVVLVNPTPITADLQLNVQNCTSFDGELEVINQTGGQNIPANYSYQLQVFNTTTSLFEDFRPIQTSDIFSGLAAGQYQVIVSDQWGCNGITGNTIDLLEPINPTADVVKAIDCVVGNTGGAITITQTGGSGAFDYEVRYPGTLPAAPADDTNTTGVFTGLTLVGDYVFTIIDQATGNCSVTITQNLQDRVDPILRIDSSTNVTCNGDDDGAITVSVPDNGVGPYTFRIISGDGSSPGSPILPTATTATTAQFTGLAGSIGAGITYTIEVRGANNCVDTQTQVITQPEPITGFNVTAAPFECTTGNNPNLATLSVDAGLTGGSNNFVRYLFVHDTSGTTLQDGPNDSFTETNLLGGDYTITVFDENGCSAVTTAVIVPFVGISDPVVTTTQEAACNPINNAEIQVSVTVTPASATPNLEYAVNGTDIVYNQTNNTGLFIGLDTGNYIVTITNLTTGCFIETTHAIADPDVIEVVATKLTDEECLNNGVDDGSIRIDINNYTGGYDYQLFDINNNPIGGVLSGNTATTLILPNLPGGGYYVRVTETDLGSSRCTADSNAVTIIAPTDPITFSVSEEASVSCSNDQGIILIDPTGGNGPYDIVLTNTTTGQPPYVENGVEAAQFTGLSAGNYTITVTDSYSCVETAAITLVRPDDFTPTISTTPLVCFNGITATAFTTVPSGRNVSATAVYEYQLNSYDDLAGTTLLQTSVVQSSTTFTGLGAGFYSITTSDNFGCSFTSPIEEIVNPSEVSAQLIRTSPLTCMTGIEFELTASGGLSGSYEYSVDNATWILMAGNTVTIPEALPGTYRYYVRDGVNGCEAVLTNEITEDPIEDLVLTVDSRAAVINCNGDSTATIYASATGGLGNYQYQLFTDLALTTNYYGPGHSQPTGEFGNLPAGTYYVNVLSGDCLEDPEEVVIIEPAVLEVVDTNNFTDVLCFGEENGTITVELTGGAGGYQYAISPNLNQFDDENVFDELTPGDYTVIAQDQNGCFVQLEYTISEPEILSATASVTPEICAGDENGIIDLTITGGTSPYSTRLSSETNFVQDRISFIDMAAGAYIIFVRDANGCETDLGITIDPGVNLNATVEPVYECTGDIPENYINITFEDTSVMGDVLYALDSTDPNDLQLNADFRNASPGTHFLRIMHSGGCPRDISFEIEDFEPLTLTLEQLDLNVITATAEGGREDYTFYFDDLNNGNDNTFRINRTDTYVVRVVDANGCEATASIEMEFIDIEIPNFFTPDGDGQNDFWMPRNQEAFPEILTLIFDRYGREVYRLGLNDPGWDGIYNDSELPTGDYWYVIKLKGENDDREFVGHFTLYR